MRELLKSLGLGLLVVIVSGAVQAQTPLRSEFRRDVDPLNTGASLETYLDSLANQKQRAYRNIGEWRSSSPKEARACADLYDSLFADGVLRMNLAFGYHDAGAFTLDGGLYAQVFGALTRPCRSTLSPVCGFRPLSGSASSYTATLVREVELTNRMGFTSDVRIQVTLAHGSDSNMDEYNLEGGSASPQQQAVTRLAEDVFFGGISGMKADGSPTEKCEICGYYGHARSGGGPDFSPVPHAWRKSNGEPNYEIYRARKPGYRKLLHSLNNTQSDPPKIVSVMACYSHKHFWSGRACIKNEPGCRPLSLENFGSRTSFVLSHEYSWPENFSGLVGVLLDMVGGLKCRSAWDANMEKLKHLPGNSEDYGVYGRSF